MGRNFTLNEHRLHIMHDDMRASLNKLVIIHTPKYVYEFSGD